jgi:hypothetical protein
MLTSFEDGSPISDESLHAFVKRCYVENLDPKDKKPVYVRGQASDRCSIVLSGHLKITSSEEGFESESAAWTILGVTALLQPVYMPDFTAKPTGTDTTRVMFITRQQFKDFTAGCAPTTLFARGNPQYTHGSCGKNHDIAS